MPTPTAFSLPTTAAQLQNPSIPRIETSHPTRKKFPVLKNARQNTVVMALHIVDADREEDGRKYATS